MSERAPGNASPDEAWMREALREAEAAARVGEVPIGAVVVHEGRVLARAKNRRETDRDPTAHAEVLALREAARALGSWRLSGCALVVTLEPCFMCAGALVNARVDRLVFGAADLKAGAVGSLADVCRDPRLNHRVAVTGGVLARESAALLRSFFAARRAPIRPSGGEASDTDQS
jgi:tRNA(adenine34) deaminase